MLNSSFPRPCQILPSSQNNLFLPCPSSLPSSILPFRRRLIRFFSDRSGTHFFALVFVPVECGPVGNLPSYNVFINWDTQLATVVIDFFVIGVLVFLSCFPQISKKISDSCTRTTDADGGVERAPCVGVFSPFCFTKLEERCTMDLFLQQSIHP